MNHLDESRQQIMAEIISTSPFGRLGRPDEVVAVVDFPTSDRASFMTGRGILADGGMVATIPGDSTGGRAFAGEPSPTDRK